jgi:hypothetical protein
MASKYSVSVAFNFFDNITAPLDRVGKVGGKVGSALKNDFVKTDRAINKIGESAGKVAKDIAKMAAKAGAAVIAAGGCRRHSVCCKRIKRRDKF